MALPTLRIIGFIIGIFLITLAISMAIPMLTLLIFIGEAVRDAFDPRKLPGGQRS